MLLYLRGNILKYLGIKCYSESSQFLNGSVKKKKKACVHACMCMYVCVTHREGKESARENSQRLVGRSL